VFPGLNVSHALNQQNLPTFSQLIDPEFLQWLIFRRVIPSLCYLHARELQDGGPTSIPIPLQNSTVLAFQQSFGPRDFMRLAMAACA